MACSYDSSVHGIVQQEYCSWLLFPTPGDLPDPETQPASLASPSMADRFIPYHCATWEARLSWRTLQMITSRLSKEKRLGFHEIT